MMYRFKNGKPEVFLVHPGGPFFKNKDDGAWSVPKGEVEENKEDMLSAAKREFEEETGIKPEGDFKYLGLAKRTGKVVEVWMFEGDCDSNKINSNTVLIDWPPRSGKKLEIPEVDRTGFFTIEEARKKLSPYMAGLIDEFERNL